MDSTTLREEIGRVLESGALHQSAVLRRILEYLGEAEVRGKNDLKEYTIGVEALGKSASYDPQRDSTVRVQVGKLRQKLDEYYREEGAARPVRISVPKGSFRLHLDSIPGSVQQPDPPRNLLRFLPAVLVALAVTGAAYYLGVRKGAESASVQSNRAWTPELHAFWQPIVGNGMPIVISYDVAMTIEVPPWKIRNPNINDAEELAVSPDWRELSDKLGRPALRTEYPYVGFGIAHGTFLLAHLLTAQRLQPVLKRSTVLSWEDLAHSNLIFIGTGKTAKIRYVLQHGDFRWDLNRVTNLKPAPGEPAEFDSAIDSRTGEYREQYGLISMMPGFDENTRVLVLGGGIAEGDWAVVEYVTLPAHVAELVRRLRSKTGDLPKAFQVVVRVRYDSRVPVSIDYVTHHLISVPGGLRREAPSSDQ